MILVGLTLGSRKVVEMKVLSLEPVLRRFCEVPRKLQDRQVQEKIVSIRWPKVIEVVEGVERVN